MADRNLSNYQGGHDISGPKEKSLVLQSNILVLKPLAGKVTLVCDIKLKKYITANINATSMHIYNTDLKGI